MFYCVYYSFRVNYRDIEAFLNFHLISPFLLHFAFTRSNAKTPEVFVIDFDVGTVVAQIVLTTSRLVSRMFNVYCLYTVYTCTLCTRDQSSNPLRLTSCC